MWSKSSSTGGYPHDGPEERRRLEMIADVHIAATEVLALGYLAGRYPDLDEVVDMLVLVTRGTAWLENGMAVQRWNRTPRHFKPATLEGSGPSPAA